MRRIYGKIFTFADLAKLEDVAQAQGTHAVGVTKSGMLYKYNPTNGRGDTISQEEAAELLSIDIAEIARLVERKGNYDLPQPEEVKVEDPVVEEPAAEPEIEVVTVPEEIKISGIEVVAVPADAPQVQNEEHEEPEEDEEEVVSQVYDNDDKVLDLLEEIQDDVTDVAEDLSKVVVHSKRIAIIEASIKLILEKLETAAAKQDAIIAKLESVQARLDAIDKKILD